MHGSAVPRGRDGAVTGTAVSLAGGGAAAGGLGPRRQHGSQKAAGLNLHLWFLEGAGPPTEVSSLGQKASHPGEEELERQGGDGPIPSTPGLEGMKTLS